MNTRKSSVLHLTRKRSQSKNYTVISTNTPNRGTTESLPTFYANTPWTSSQTPVTGWCSTAQWTPSGSRTWTLCWMTAGSCVWQMERESSCILRWGFSLRSRIWSRPVQPLLVGVEWFMSADRLWIALTLFIAIFTV